MKIKCIELNKEDFSPYGKIMAGADVKDFEPLGQHDDYTWTATAEGVDMDRKCCSGMLICRNREMVVGKMEHHARTSEILVAVKNDYVLCVAPANSQKPEMDKIMAFKVKEGTVLVMNEACWHWIPFPLNNKNAEILVIFRDNTGTDDLVYADLPEDVDIEL